MSILLFFASAFATDVNVMLPLTTVSKTGVLDVSVANAFPTLKAAGVHGVMVDVWWGICEATAKNYNFAAYVKLADLCKANGLKMQAVMSFHRCGGNVGDTCDIPIPSWARSVKNTFYRDQWGWDDTEVVSGDVDNDAIFSGRTPVTVYKEFMTAFRAAMASRMGTVVDEIQVGLGPCGELRYPGYQLDRWNFPGIGGFQAFSPKMKSLFANASKQAGHPEWTSPPTDAGGYNSKPDDTNFFRAGSGGYQTAYGKFFMNWYSTQLIEHGRRVMTAAKSVFANTGAAIALKVAGIHWWYDHASHAAEMTTGYANGNGITGNNFYQRAAALCKETGAILDFTCFEMSNNEQSAAAKCNPQGLVAQVLSVAKTAGVKISGENALERYDSTGYNRIIDNVCNKGTKVTAMTYLRLTPKLWQDTTNLNEFKRFVTALSKC